MRRVLILLASLTLVLASGSATAAPNHPLVRLVTSQGDIVLQLDRTKAPKTVANFLRYVNEGFYNGTIFHRVINGFMIQGGGYTADYQRKPTHAPIANEADNGLRNVVGTIAMARTNDPQSATAQFFINVANNDFLDFHSKTPRGWGYAVFGHVIKGMDTVRRIKALPTGPGGPFSRDVPQQTVLIKKAFVETAAKTKTGAHK